MKRYAAVTDQTLRAAAEAVSGAERAPIKSAVSPNEILTCCIGNSAVGKYKNGGEH